MDSSGLLISCAMDEARRPTTASLSLSMRASSALRCWVISSEAAVMPWMVPSVPSTG